MEIMTDIWYALFLTFILRLNLRSTTTYIRHEKTVN